MAVPVTEQGISDSIALHVVNFPGSAIQLDATLAKRITRPVNAT